MNQGARSGPVILALQSGGHDTAAALMVGGELIAACEQERYTLDKHSQQFPIDAMRDCLRIGGISLDDVDELASCFDPMLLIRETYLRTAMTDPKRIGFLIQDIDRVKAHYNTESSIREKIGYKGPITFHNHHLCHLASAYYPSGFNDALLVSHDGMGEIESGAIGLGQNGDIEVVQCANRYPDSLGLIYSAVTFYLGFRHHCDEGIVMGLAPYGNADALVPGTKRSYGSFFEEIIEETGDYTYRINRDWIAYHEKRDTWISSKFIETFGPRREVKTPITNNHENLAAGLQHRLEQLALAQLRRARKQYGMSRLALAGGVALNCSMNGKIEASGIFDEIFVQPASGDSGTAVGACYLSHKKLVGDLRPRKQHNNYMGTGFTDEEIIAAFMKAGMKYTRSDDIYAETAKRLQAGKIIGWAQGRAEFGPRALGNRSILTRPYPAQMKDHLNAKVKFREYFRPFAPAVLAEHCREYFTIKQESPHMLMACQATEKKRDQIPAVVHVDGSCRVQTVTAESNPRFRKLLEAFYKLTDIPVLLNTSYNVKGQPIVNTAQQVVDSFASMQMDFLALGDFYAEKP